MSRSLQHRLERLEAIIPEMQEEEIVLFTIDARIGACSDIDPAKFLTIEKQRKIICNLKSLPRLARRKRRI